MVKNFIYLDKEKMYSLSSQLFEGVTEYVLSESTSEKNESEEQKGPVGSGRILGDILRNSERNTEKKFLNDYSYTIFEKKLLDDGRVSVVSDAEFSTEECLGDKTFIKITSKAIFNDINSINETLKNFNKIIKALVHIERAEEISAVKEQLEKAKQNARDRNQKSQLQAQLKSINIDKLASESGLQKDQELLDDLVLLLSYGFQDQLEVQMNAKDKIFSANLNRSFLREPEDLTIRKYSRQTEVELTLFGIVTQHQRKKLEKLEEKNYSNSLKEVIRTLVFHLSDVEATFSGRLSNEIIVDPIALYTEI